MRVAVLLVVAFVALAFQPVARGGTATNPEMMGNCGELLSTSGSTSIGAPEVRLCAAWFDEPDAMTVRVSWQVVDLSHRLRPDEWLEFQVICADRVGTLVTLSVGGPVPPQGDVNGVRSAWGVPEIHGNVASLTVPRDAFPQPGCPQPIAYSSVAFKSPTSTTYADTWPVWFGQTAPDSGRGRSYDF